MRCLTHLRNWCGVGAVVALLSSAGCGKSADDEAVPVARNPKEAATQLETAFGKAPAETRDAAAAAADALRKQEYEKAIVSLQTVKSGQNVSLDQGLAIHNSLVTLEAELISAAAAGDPKAKQAYELLKAVKRK